VAKTPATKRRSPGSTRISRHQKQVRLIRWATIATYIALGIAGLVLVFGLVQQYILAPRKPVATVAGVPIRLDTYQKHYRFLYWSYKNNIQTLEAQKQMLGTSEELALWVEQIDGQITQLNYEITLLPTTVLDNLIDAELTRQEATLRAITVTPDEVQREIERQFGYDRDAPTPEPTAAPSVITDTAATTDTSASYYTSEEHYQSQYSEWLAAATAASGMTEEDIWTYIENSLLKQALADDIRAGTPTTAEQIHVAHVVVDTQEEARAVLDRLQAGEDFASVAAEVSTDEETKDDGGDLGWLPRGIRPAPFDDAAFALEPNGLSDVVMVGYSYEIIKVLERDPARELSEEHLLILQDAAVSDWYAERRIAEDVVRSWDYSMVPTVDY